MKNKIYVQILTILIIISTTHLYSQQKDRTLQDLYSKTKILEIAIEHYDNGWIKFKEDLKINPKTIFVKYKKYFGLENNDEMILEMEWNDSLGYAHYRYQQYYKGIKIENAQYLIHAKNGIATIANGKIVPNININISAKLDKTTAQDIYLQYLKNKLTTKQDSNVIEIPKGELIISSKPKTTIINHENYLLTYKFESKSKNTIYIDCNNGLVIKEVEAIRYSYDVTEETATIQTLFYGSKSIKTISYKDFWPWVTFYGLNYYKNGHLILDVADASQSTSSCWYDWTTGKWICNSFDGFWFSHEDDNNWSSYSERTAGTALWCAEQTYDYFKNNHNISGINNNDALVDLMFNISFEGTANASFDLSTNTMALGEAVDNICNVGVSLDIIAHEWTHGISHYIKNLTIYEGEKGALNESFSDVFAAIIQESVEGFNQNRIYQIGEDFIIPGDANKKFLRSFQTPKLFGQHHVIDFNCNNIQLGQPDTYQGDFWFPASCDYGGVHTNSGVANHWFYLLAEGGSGVNDKGFQYNVNGIGFDDAKKIFLSTYFNYIETNSEFIDYRNATLIATAILFGECSNQYGQVQRAWNAVGIPTPITTDFTGTPKVFGPTMSCSSSSTFSVNNVPVGASVDWVSSPNLLLISSSGNTATFTPIESGRGWVQPKIHTTCGIHYVPKYDLQYVGSPIYVFQVTRPDGHPVTIDPYGSLSFCPFTDYDIYISTNGSDCYTHNERWNVPSDWTINYNNGYNISINTGNEPYNCISVDILNCCDEDVTISQCFENSTSCVNPSYSLKIVPNPSINETALIIESNTDQKLDETIHLENLEIYDSMQKLIAKEQKIIGNQKIINTSTWKEGVYIVSIKVNGRIVKGKLLVKK